MWPRDPERRRRENTGGYIGKTPEKFRKDHPNKPIRVIKPGYAITMDYCKERANLEVDKNGFISKIWYG